MWQRYAIGEIPLPGLKPSGKYAQSIRTKKLGPFAYEIFSAAKTAERIENGTEELDMKETHTKGPRSRMSKTTGYPYVIIPFRWGTPPKKGEQRVGFGKNIMTAGAYKQLLAKSFKASRVKESPNTSSYQTPNAHGQMVGRARYQWGSRLRGSDFAGKIEEKTRMKGMVRFENGLDENRNIGGKRYGGYFTFRIISANPESDSWKQNKWIRPATPGVPVTKIVAEKTHGDIEKMIDSAIMGDLPI
jgi:hypothetical protein